MQGFRKADFTVGNAGQEVIEAMSQSFQRMRPEKTFQTLGQYLEFRRHNVGAESVTLDPQHRFTSTDNSNQLRARSCEVLDQLEYPNYRSSVNQVSDISEEPSGHR